MKFVITTILIALLTTLATNKPTPETVFAHTATKPTEQKINITPTNKPTSWVVTSSPNTLVSVSQINQVLQILKQKGLSKEGASYLTGNFITESFLKPCEHYGDGGLAYGLGQWHPTRRTDMPCGLEEQINWAIDIEMVRDAKQMNYTCTCEVLKTNNIPDIKYSLQKWERWGVLGGRWVYSENIYNQIKLQ